MSNFGEIKTKLLSKLTESYMSDNKSEIKDLVNKLKSNKNLVEMYMFYEGIENLNISTKDKAKLYVESIEPILIDKMKSIKKDCKEFGKSLKNVVAESNEMYDCLDVLSEENNIHNISKKIESRDKFINLLMTKKETKKVEEPTVHTENHSLLNAVLVNNFNVKFTDFLNEEQKQTFSKIVSMSNEDLSKEMNTLKEDINKKIESLLTESSDDSMNDKLKKVKSDVNESEVTRYNYYKLIELKSGLV